MPVVSNTSPLLGLAVTGCLHLLQKQFGEIFIPPSVFSELKTETNFIGAQAIGEAINAGWVRILDIENVHLAQALSMELDQGEAQAITLALQLQVESILMDERDGRAKAKALGLKVFGVLGVLLRAKKEGDVQSIESTMLELRHRLGFFIDDELFQRILTEAGEKRG